MKRLLSLYLALGAVFCASCFMNPAAIHTYKRDLPLPDYNERLTLASLSGQVDIYRDQYGIPHIFADNEHDLFFAVGYAHAQDRLWEMMLMRAIAEGRTCELLGNVGVPGVELMGMEASTLSIDKRQRVMGMWHVGKLEAELLKTTDPAVYAQFAAYSDGVNAYIAAHPDLRDLPLEFQLLRLKPEPWRPEDITAFGRFIASMLCSNMPAELTRYAAIHEFGVDRGWELAPLFYNQGPSIVPAELLKNKLAEPRDLPPGGKPSELELGFSPPLARHQAADLLRFERAIREATRFDERVGSNNWVVSGKLTESGRAILANDPHMNHVQPSLFYIMHLSGAGFDVYGATFPGNPYVALGHAREAAWGATTSRADVQDLFIEKTDPERPGEYYYRGEWRPFVVREEVIKVRMGADRKFPIRQTAHGPIMNEVLPHLAKDAPPVALRWTGWDLSRDLRAFDLAVSSPTVENFMQKYLAMDENFEVLSVAYFYNKMMKARSVEDFKAGLDKLVVPNQNWVAADEDGHIIYLPGGLVPRRARGLGMLPNPGESGEFDWIGFVPLMELPYLEDPERGYVASANNQVVDARWYPHVFSTSYGEPWRAARIEELIMELAPLDVADMARIQGDIYVKRAEWEVPLILAAVERKGGSDPRVARARAQLEGWDYMADLDSTATIIFFQFAKELMRNILEDDAEDWMIYKLEGYPDMAINAMIERGESWFFDDRRTPEVEDLDDMMVKSLADAMAWVEKKYGEDPAGYEWGKVHYMKFYHPLGLFGEYKNLHVGPWPHTGADQTVKMAREAGFGKDPYKAVMGASIRHVMEMGDPENAIFVIDGSQSGMYLSPHYDDIHRLWMEGRFVRTVMSRDEIAGSAAYHQVLAP